MPSLPAQSAPSCGVRRRMSSTGTGQRAAAQVKGALSEIEGDPYLRQCVAYQGGACWASSPMEPLLLRDRTASATGAKPVGRLTAPSRLDSTPGSRCGSVPSPGCCCPAGPDNSSDRQTLGLDDGFRQ